MVPRRRLPLTFDPLTPIKVDRLIPLQGRSWVSVAGVRISEGPGAESRWGLGAKPPETKFKRYINEAYRKAVFRIYPVRSNFLFV